MQIHKPHIFRQPFLILKNLRHRILRHRPIMMRHRCPLDIVADILHISLNIPGFLYPLYPKWKSAFTGLVGSKQVTSNWKRSRYHTFASQFISLARKKGFSVPYPQSEDICYLQVVSLLFCWNNHQSAPTLTVQDLISPYQCDAYKRNAKVRDNPISAHKYKESPETYSLQSFHVPVFIFIHFLPA